MQTAGNQINHEDREDLLTGQNREPQYAVNVQDDAAKAKKKKIIIGVIVGVVVIGVALAIILPLTLNKGGGSDPVVNPPNPFDYQEYNPYVLDKTKIEQNDWTSSGVIYNPQAVPEKIDAVFSSLKDGERTPGRNYKPVNPGNVQHGANNVFASKLGYAFSLVDNFQARIRIFDQDKENSKSTYSVSEDVFPRPVESFEARLSQVGLNIKQDGPFSFSLGNIYNGETLISTEKRKLAVAEKFSEIGLRLPTNRIFGLGQHNSQFQLKNGTYSLWARGFDGAMPFDNGNGGVSGSHIHPFVLCQTQNKDFFGIYFVGTTAQAFEVVYFNNYKEVVLNYITLGGEIEMYVIMRGTANEVISKYHAMIGHSQMPPFYSLGVTQGSNAYKNSADLKNVLKGYSDAAINIEGLHVEKYYLAGQVFSSDLIPDLGQVITDVHAKNQKVYISIDSGITNDPAYTFRNNYNTFIRSNITNDELVGEQNGVKVVYPDFFNNDVEKLYKDGIVALAGKIGVADGMIFKNLQFSNALNGEYLAPKPDTKRVLSADNAKNEDESGDAATYYLGGNQNEESFYNLPFIPGYDQQGFLDHLTISLNATHSGYSQDKQIKGTIEFYVHNANGHMGLKRLRKVCEKVIPKQTRRSLIFADTTYAGSGAHAAALITNVYRNWDNLKSTVSMAMGLSMFGFSNIVTDVCGTVGPLDEELCGRWMQLAAFLPMARNYYGGNYKLEDGTQVATEPSEFYKIKNEDYKQMVGSAIQQKLSFARYTYSQMYKIYRDGGSIVRPLFFEYPENDLCFDQKFIDSVYMYGDSILVSPVLTPKAAVYESFLPQGDWADLNDLSVVYTSKGDGSMQLSASTSHTNAFLKAGKIVPFQSSAMTAKTTYDLEQQAITFIVHRDPSKYSDGYIHVDDGISHNSFESEQYTLWKVRQADKGINFWVEQGNVTYVPTNSKADQLEEIKIVNAEDLENTDFACYLGTSFAPQNLTFSYNKYLRILSIKPQEGTLHFKDIGSIKFGNSQEEPNFCNVNAFSYKVSGTISSSRTNITFKLTNLQNPTVNPDLVFSAQLISNDGVIRTFITTIDDFNNVPGKIKFRPPYVVEDSQYQEDKVTKNILDFISWELEPFEYSFHVEGESENVLYRSNPNKLFVSDYFVMDEGIFSLNAATGYPLLGMGEKAGSLFYKNEQGGVHSRYAFDQANPIDDGLPPGRNMYGVQPLYMYQEPGNKYVGVFNLNSYAQDFILYFNDGKNTTITNIMIGGLINRYFFVGAKPDDIIVKYQKLVGMPMATPLWSFGWQQSRFGYVTEDKWWSVYEQYKNSDLPLDTMWADIDYMDDYKIFTISKSRYGNLPQKVKQLHDDGVTFVPIMDAGVAVRQASENYKALQDGLAQDIFIKQANGKDPLTAGVWCGNAYFPDLFSDKGATYWKDMLEYLYTELDLKFDGIWLDENEATNFCNGYCKPSERPQDSLRNKPFWVPGQRDLEDKALGVDGVHSTGWKEYDYHNLFALAQSRATHDYLHGKGMIPYVLTRSNFPGIGKYAHHWLADNWTTDQYMKLSVSGLYSYQLFGMPFIGSDICGFNSNETDVKNIAATCTKWHQLGSLYPFARNHNQNATLAHEPFEFDFNYKGTTTYLSLIQEALQVRYNFIRYFYSAFTRIEEYGGSFFRPAFFDFPNDPMAYVDVENNIFLGHAIKASILVNTTVLPATDHYSTFYFPKANWCQIYPLADKTNPNYCFTSAGGSDISANRKLRTNLEDYYLHMKAGSMVPYQRAQAAKVKNTKDLAKLPTDLLILPADQASTYQLGSGYAGGFLYLDDGVTTETPVARFDFLTSIGTSTIDITFRMNGTFEGKGLIEEQLGEIKIYWVSHFQFKSTDFDAIVTIGDDKFKLDSPTYDANSDILTIKGSYTDDKKVAQQLNLFTLGKVDGFIKLSPKA